MPKKNPKFKSEIMSYGLYAKWSNRCSELPKFLKFTTTIPARVDAEFGFIIKVVGAKGLKLNYKITHPVFNENDKHLNSPFRGELPIRSNSWEAYVGDTLWLPVDDKMGEWVVSASILGKEVGKKSFEIIEDSGEFSEIIEKNRLVHLSKLDK
jgi:hypothetical protein